MAAAKPTPYQTAAFQFGASTVLQLSHLEAVLTDAVSLAATTGAFASRTFEETYDAYLRGKESPAHCLQLVFGGDGLIECCGRPAALLEDGELITRKTATPAGVSLAGAMSRWGRTTTPLLSAAPFSPPGWTPPPSMTPGQLRLAGGVADAVTRRATLCATDAGATVADSSALAVSDGGDRAALEFLTTLGTPSPSSSETSFDTFALRAVADLLRGMPPTLLVDEGQHLLLEAAAPAIPRAPCSSSGAKIALLAAAAKGDAPPIASLDEEKTWLNLYQTRPELARAFGSLDAWLEEDGKPLRELERADLEALTRIAADDDAQEWALPVAAKAKEALAVVDDRERAAAAAAAAARAGETATSTSAQDGPRVADGIDATTSQEAVASLNDGCLSHEQLTKLSREARYAVYFEAARRLVEDTGRVDATKGNWPFADELRITYQSWLSNRRTKTVRDIQTLERLDGISAAWRDPLQRGVACDEEDMLQEIRASALYGIPRKDDSVRRGRQYLRDLRRYGGSPFLLRSRGFLEGLASLSCDVIDPPDWLRKAELDAANALDELDARAAAAARTAAEPAAAATFVGDISQTTQTEALRGFWLGELGTTEIEALSLEARNAVYVEIARQRHAATGYVDAQGWDDLLATKYANWLRRQRTTQTRRPSLLAKLDAIEPGWRDSIHSKRKRERAAELAAELAAESDDELLEDLPAKSQKVE